MIFTIAVIIYNYLYLPDGFNATDEGWLLSLGQRISHGQVPYRDFYFLINPLAVYAQSILISVFGESYTVLASRIYWAVQMWLMITVFSAVYRKYVNDLEMLLLLLASWVVSTLMIQYPWYNYEAVFYSSLAIVALSKKKYYLLGVLAFLAFWAKQNYVLLLPLIFGLGYLLKFLKIKAEYISGRTIRQTTMGFLVPAAIWLVYLVSTGSLSAYITDAYIYLPEVTARGWLFGIFQNNHVAIVFSLPLIAMILLLAYSKNFKWLIVPVLLVPVVGFMIYYRIALINYNAAIINHAVTIFLIWRIKRAKDRAEKERLLSFLPVQLAASVMVYLSGFSYVGIVTSYMASGVALTVSYCSLKMAAPSVYKKYFPAIIMILILGSGAIIKYNYIYRDAPRDQLLSEFTSGKMKGIRTTARNFNQISDLIKAVDFYTDKGDFILIYPDFPVLYYLTDRRNPTRVDWYYWRGLHPDMVIDAAKNIAKYKPKVIFVQKYSEDDYLRMGKGIDYVNGKEYAPLFKFISRNYRLERAVGDIFLFVPGV